MRFSVPVSFRIQEQAHSFDIETIYIQSLFNHCLQPRVSPTSRRKRPRSSRGKTASAFRTASVFFSSAVFSVVLLSLASSCRLPLPLPIFWNRESPRRYERVSFLLSRPLQIRQ